MKYSDPNWIPPEQWDEGIPGMMLDYNINAQVNEGDGYSNRNISSYGTLGFNYGAWRLRVTTRPMPTGVTTSAPLPS